jgi:hypothetical protein
MPECRGGETTLAFGPGAAASRDEVLRPLVDQLFDTGARSATTPEALPGRAVDDVVPNPELRPLLLADAALAMPLPIRGTDLDGVYGLFERLILPYPTGNTHPRFMGWAHGSGTPAGALAELLAGVLALGRARAGGSPPRGAERSRTSPRE